MAEKEKTAPVQGWPAGIPWSLHLEAYAAYCKRWSPQPALIDLEGKNCRGGFHVDELDEFIPGWRERASEITALREEVAELRAALESRAGNAGGVHPDHLVLLKPFMSERDGLLSHSLTVYLREMADPEFAERMHKARARLYTATNAGGAVWIQRDHLEKAKMGAYLCRVEAEYRDGMGFVPLYPAPASKEPVADELAAWQEGYKAGIEKGRKDPVMHEAKYVDGYRAALATAQTWQPIETAPKDGTSILIHVPGNDRKPVQEAWWALRYDGDDAGYWQTPIGPAGRGYMILPVAVTHWMPLPAAPAKPEGV